MPTPQEVKYLVGWASCPTQNTNCILCLFMSITYGGMLELIWMVDPAWRKQYETIDPHPSICPMAGNLFTL